MHHISKLVLAIVLLMGWLVAAQDEFEPCRSFDVDPIVATEGEPLVITWEPCAGAEAYSVLVVQGQNIVVHETVSETTLTVDAPLEAGVTYYGVVAAKDAAGETIRESIFSPFEPLTAGEIPGTVVATVLWNGEPLAGIPVALSPRCSPSNRRLATVTDDDGQVIFERVVPGTITVIVNYPIMDGPESDFAYTRGCPSEQELTSSGTVEFVMHLAKKDLAVEDLTPATTVTTPTITWEPYPDAVSYAVEIGYPLILETTTTETSLTAPPLAAWETFRAVVRAYNAEGIAIAEGTSGTFEVRPTGQERPTPTPTPAPAFDTLQIAAESYEVRVEVLQGQPGETLELFIGSFECCYIMQRVEVEQLTWNVEPAEYATISAEGTLTIAEDAPHGTALTVTATHEGTPLSETIYVYRPAENPLIGEWRQWAALDCDTGNDRRTNISLIGELLFLANGDYYLTWQPFEVYFDYRGTYSYDNETGNLTLTQEGINYAPHDFTGQGMATIDAVGDLLITGIDFGTPPYGGISQLGCGYRFTQDKNRVASLVTQSPLLLNPTEDGIIAGVVSWRVDEDYDGIPQEGVGVRLLQVTDNGGTETLITETITDAEGAYRFEELPPGTYRVVPVDPYVQGRAPADEVEVGVYEQEMKVLRDDVALSVEGRTVSWEPYPDASRYLISLYEAHPYYSSITSYADVEALSYTLPDDLPPGRYAVVVRVNGDGFGLAQSFIEVEISSR